VRYKQAAFGIVWAVAQPVTTLIVFTILFHRLADVPSDGVPYVLFAFVGTMLWSLFSGGLDAATTSLVSNSSLVTKVYFPRAAAPLAGVLAKLLDFGVALSLLVVLFAVDHRAPPITLVFLPLIVAWTMLLALGFGLAFATVQVRYRDAHHAMSLITQLWIYASPVAYSSTLVPGRWRWVYSLNPIVGVLDTARWSLLDAPAPGPRVLFSVCTTLVAVVVGVRTFARSERRFADII
jgi:lipopolysaccharide transport system permease protein